MSHCFSVGISEISSWRRLRYGMPQHDDTLGLQCGPPLPPSPRWGISARLSSKGLLQHDLPLFPPPATAWVEGAQLNGRPSLWERVRVMVPQAHAALHRPSPLPS